MRPSLRRPVFIPARRIYHLRRQNRLSSASERGCKFCQVRKNILDGTSFQGS